MVRLASRGNALRSYLVDRAAAPDFTAGLARRSATPLRRTVDIAVPVDDHAGRRPETIPLPVVVREPMEDRLLSGFRNFPHRALLTLGRVGVGCAVEVAVVQQRVAVGFVIPGEGVNVLVAPRPGRIVSGGRQRERRAVLVVAAPMGGAEEDSILVHDDIGGRQSAVQMLTPSVYRIEPPENGFGPRRRQFPHRPVVPVAFRRVYR